MKDFELKIGKNAVNFIVEDTKVYKDVNTGQTFLAQNEKYYYIGKENLKKIEYNFNLIEVKEEGKLYTGFYTLEEKEDSEKESLELEYYTYMFTFDYDDKAAIYEPTFKIHVRKDITTSKDRMKYIRDNVKYTQKKLKDPDYAGCIGYFYNSLEYDEELIKEVSKRIIKNNQHYIDTTTAEIKAIEEAMKNLDKVEIIDHTKEE